jgi:hypothetical protein
MFPLSKAPGSGVAFPLVVLTTLLVRDVCVNAYVPPLSRETLAGVWRLSGRRSILPSFINESQKHQQHLENKAATNALKEFTVFSNMHYRAIAATIYKAKKDSSMSKSTVATLDKPEQASYSTTWYAHSDVFLKLCSDGSFEQYASFDEIDLTEEEEEDEDHSIENSDKNDENADADFTQTFLEDISSGGNAAEAIKGLAANMDYSKYTDYTPPKASDLAEKNKLKDNDDGVYIIKGKWDFQDGELILATNRPPNTDPRQVHDTVLVGRVAVAAEQGEDTGSSSSTNTTSLLHEGNASSNNRKGDTHTDARRLLTVPKGKVKIGKYFYPMNHPSFFERPIYDPTKAGSFELRQVLGEINSNKGPHDDGGGWWTSRDYTEEMVEKFKKEQLMNRTYFLTSQPIGYEKKNKPRWSRSVKAFVVDKAPINDNAPISGINVMEMQLFANNTFSTTAGLGSSTVLRGKWAIIGTARNYLWFQVWRFGFGRSVSGSTFR